MNELQIFNNPEFGNIRTTMIDGEPWLLEKMWLYLWGTQNH